MNPKARGWVTAVAMLASVFLAGLLGGVAVAELRDPPPDAPRWRELRDRDGRGGGGPNRRGGGVTPLLPPRLVEELGLGDEQRARVQEILERRGAAAEAILEGVGPRLRAQVDSGHQEIRALLDPDQQEVFDRLFQQMRARRPRGGPARPPPGGGR